MKYALTEIIGLSKIKIPKVTKDTTMGLNKTEIKEASFSFWKYEFNEWVLFSLLIYKL